MVFTAHLLALDRSFHRHDRPAPRLRCRKLRPLLLRAPQVIGHLGPDCHITARHYRRLHSDYFAGDARSW